VSDRPLLRLLDRFRPLFEGGGRFERLGPIYRAFDTFFYSTDEVVRRTPLIRDILDIKRVMVFVILALAPAGLFALYNTGYQSNRAIAAGADPGEGWRVALLTAMGVPFAPDSLWACVLHGSMYVIPIAIVTYTVGGLWEALFDIIRKEEISESFLVTGALFTLIVAPTTPLWQVALGISFGIVIGKMIFGGTGFNVFNPALTGRAFLFFAYPAQMSGDQVWVAVDGVTSATPLARATTDSAALMAEPGLWWDAFLGFIPGSVGETSALACLIGASFLLVTRIASWRTMAAVAAGTIAMSLVFNAVASDSNPMMALPFWWHMVLGGWAFGAVFMATEPVTSPHTNWGKAVYGLLIGAMIVLVRVINPSFPEGVMLSILLMNIFAPLIDYYVARVVIRRRSARHG
jgi:Na+-transporting NADH:ubiquinone oxidoreductase subunit B